MHKNVSALALVVVTGCMSTPPTYVPGPVHHVVICWLREPGDKGDRKKLIDTSYAFEKISGVQTVHAGGSIPSTRDVVDGSYDVAIVMTFKSVQALDDYLADPRHKESVEQTLRPLVQRMIVYDFIDGQAVY